MAKRIEQVNELIKEELGIIILREMEFPARPLVTVTRVQTSSDLLEARVFISVLPRNKEKTVFQSLNSAIYNLQQLLNKRLRMRPIPKIIFKTEEKTAEAGRIEELLEQLKKEEK